MNTFSMLFILNIVLSACLASVSKKRFLKRRSEETVWAREQRQRRERTSDMFRFAVATRGVSSLAGFEVGKFLAGGKDRPTGFFTYFVALSFLEILVMSR